MRTFTLSAIFACACVLLVSGCNSEMDNLRIQNSKQQELINRLTTDLNTANTKLNQLRNQLAAAQQTDSIEVDALQQKIAALEEDIAKKKELIESMQQRLLLGGGALPVELSTLLEDFAEQRPEITNNARFINIVNNEHVALGNCLNIKIINFDNTGIFLRKQSP